MHVLCILKGSRGFFTMLLKFLSRISVYAANHKGPPFMEHYARLRQREGLGKLSCRGDLKKTLLSSG